LLTNPFRSPGESTYHVGWEVVFNEALLQKEWPPVIDHTQNSDCALPKDEVATLLEDWKGVMVNVMGRYNVGKSWLLDQLCKQPGKEVMLPAGMNMSTSGISAKCGIVNDQRLVLVDMQGGNTPIPSVEQHEMTMALTEQSFLRTVVSKLCDNFMFVVGQLTLSEQKDLLDLCKLCKKTDKKIFVVHNFMDVKDEEEFNSRIEQVFALLGAIDDTKATANNVPRREGTVFTQDVDGRKHTGRISKPPNGSIIHVEWEEQDRVQSSFALEEWQDLVGQGKICEKEPVVVAEGCRFGEERYTPDQSTRTIRTLVGSMDGVDQVHFFLACDSSVNGSIAGTNWNKITIDHLRYKMISSGKRRQGKGKGPNRFNFLVELEDAFAKVMPKVFRSKTHGKRAVPELMRHAGGQLLLWANLEGEQPGKCLQFVPEGLFASNFVLDATDIQNDVRANRYSKTHQLEDGFQVEQQKFVLEVPGYDKVDATPLPENDDIEIDDNKLTVRLSRQPLFPMEEWNEHGANNIFAVEHKIQTYDMDMNWTNTEITQKDGLLTILIHGKKRSQRSDIGKAAGFAVMEVHDVDIQNLKAAGFEVQEVHDAGIQLGNDDEMNSDTEMSANESGLANQR
jgi:GTP-binding protein EngB required for normal cell division